MAASSREVLPTVRLSVEVVTGDITTQPTPVAVVGRYTGTPPSTAQKTYDARLGGWLTRLIEQGGVGSDLGQLFFVPLPPGLMAAEVLLVAGMGDPEEFGRDELRLLMTNVTAAVVGLGRTEFSTLLIGAGWARLNPGPAVNALVEGVADGVRRARRTRGEVVRVKIVQHKPEIAAAAAKVLEELKKESLPGVEFVPPSVAPVGGAGLPAMAYDLFAPPSSPLEATSPEVVEQDNSLRVSVLLPQASTGDDAPVASVAPSFVRLQFTTLGRAAVLPVQEAEVQPYFTERMPEVFTRPTLTADDQQRYARLLTAYLLPDDVRLAMLDSGTNGVTLTVDRRTAMLPWEVVALDRRTPDAGGRGAYLGVTTGLVRQLRTPTGPGRAVAPLLNDGLRALVIADPTGELPQAGLEGLTVARALAEAHQSAGGRFSLALDLRFGPPLGQTTSADKPLQLARLFRQLFPELEVTAAACDPLEVLALVANDNYDLIHFAGHGGTIAGRSGWVFSGCVLSAAELLRGRRAPRLVFANACRSGTLGTDPRERPLSPLAGLAEGFLDRGVRNYIGTGWAVADAPARTLAAEFYHRALGTATDPPAVLGEALREARTLTQRSDPDGVTWGAYQHYGQWTDRLLPLHSSGN